MKKSTLLGVLATVLLLRPPLLSAGEWSPHLEFQLEDSSYKETLIWLSGVSYAWSAMWAGIPVGELHGPCTLTNSVVRSKELVDVLNEVHKGKTITSEQAIQTLKEKIIPAHIRCSE